MTLAVAELRGVDLSLGGRPVLEGVDLRVGQDDFIAIIGPNGGGKSTLLRVLLGLLPASGGDVLLWGHPPQVHRHRVGYVPQFPRFPDGFPVSVAEVVAMGRLYRRSLLSRMRGEDRDAVERQLVRLGLEDLRRRPVSELSGGERQRVLIARALAAEPELLLLDEPTASLDAATAGKVYELLDELGAGLPILLVSHDLTAVAQHVKSIGCLNRRLYYHGNRELLDEDVAATYGCPVDLIAHGHPHRVLANHDHPERDS